MCKFFSNLVFLIRKCSNTKLFHQVLSLEEQNSKSERSLAFERKLHEDLKMKYTALKKDNDDLSAEYINLKSNFQSLASQHEEQVPT